MSGEGQTPNNEDLRMAYQQVCSSHNAIADFRAKLLGFLPLASGAGIFLLLNDNVTKFGFAKLYLSPIGIFGFVVTLGLFLYELRGIQQCNRLTEVGKNIEDLLDIDGQFKRRIAPISPLISHTRAAQVIYPAVLAAWIFLVLFFIWPSSLIFTWPLSLVFIVLQWIILLGLPILIFFIGYRRSHDLHLEGDLEKPNMSAVLRKMLKVIDQNVPMNSTDKERVERLEGRLRELSNDKRLPTQRDWQELDELVNDR